jgi:uncharacterized membrane protein HdeD (DUF308 family)
MTVESLSRNWWLVLLRGIAAVLFGLTAFFWPGLTFAVLVLAFGAYVLIDGVFSLVSGFMSIGKSSRWWVFVLEGLVSIVMGVLTFVWPGVTALALIYLIAAWAVITGVLEVAAAIRLRKEIDNEWMLALSGVASVLLGILLVFQPAAGSVAVIWMIGAYALIFGVLMIVLSFRLRSWRKQNSGTRGNTYQQPAYK